MVIKVEGIQKVRAEEISEAIKLDEMVTQAWVMFNQARKLCNIRIWLSIMLMMSDAVITSTILFVTE